MELPSTLTACVLVDMELVEVCTLWGIRLAVLIKPEYKHFVSRIQRASVRTGIANALGKIQFEIWPRNNDLKNKFHKLML